MLTRFRHLALPALLGALIFSVYVFTSPNDLQNNGDTLLRYETAATLVDKGHIWVAHPTWTDKREVFGIDHKFYTIYDPGQIYAMIPFYIAGKFLAHHVTGDYSYTPYYVTHMLDDVFGAMLAIVFFFLALRLGYRRRVAALLTLIFAFATVIWPDSESMLEHTQVTFGIALAVLFSLIYVQGGMKQRWWIVGAALGIGSAFLTRYDTGILFPIIPFYLAAAHFARRQELIQGDKSSPPPSAIPAILTDWAVYTIAAIPSLAAAAAWNYGRFGSITKTGIPATFGEPIWQGLSGLILSPGKGIVWYMPIVFALPFVIREFYRSHTLTTYLFGAFVVAEFALFSTVIYWHGDPAWGPRYIFTTAPFLTLPLGIILERWSSYTSGIRTAFISLIALSASVQVVGVVAPQYRFWYREMHAQLVDHEGFNWGPKQGHFWYYYYWNVDRNPILIGFRDLYEITALKYLGQSQFNLSQSPIPPTEHLKLTNPVHNYEINNYNLWWMGAYHPFLGPKKDMLLATFWVFLIWMFALLLRLELKREPKRARQPVIDVSRPPPAMSQA